MLGTSPVASDIETAAGGRPGLTAVIVAGLFLARSVRKLRRAGVARATPATRPADARCAGLRRAPRQPSASASVADSVLKSKASSSSCSWMMLSPSKMARLVCPVRRMATRSGTLAPGGPGRARSGWHRAGQ